VDAILGATARILVARGWSGLTTNHVAARAGVSVGTLYEWFPGKEGLVAALVDRHLDRAEALLTERAAALAALASAEPPIALARALATVMVELHEDDPRLHRVLTEEVPHPASTRARIAAIEASMTEALTQVLAAHPGLTVERPALAARMIVGLLEAATHRWATGDDGALVPRHVLIEELAWMITGYLATRRSGVPEPAGAAGAA
jgi:AcrR family transcriptional regulator